MSEDTMFDFNGDYSMTTDVLKILAPLRARLAEAKVACAQDLAAGRDLSVAGGYIVTVRSATMSLLFEDASPEEVMDYCATALANAAPTCEALQDEFTGKFLRLLSELLATVAQYAAEDAVEAEAIRP
jgi:hypothetical protein